MTIREISQYSFGILIILIITILPLAYFTGDTKRLEGTVIGLNANTHEEGVYPYLIIKLDNNKTITSRIQLSSMYRKNA